MSDSNRRSVSLQLRCTPSERDSIHAAAKARDMKTSMYLRDLHAEAGKPVPDRLFFFKLLGYVSARSCYCDQDSADEMCLPCQARAYQ